jgi:hypothetical protein
LQSKGNIKECYKKPQTRDNKNSELKDKKVAKSTKEEEIDLKIIGNKLKENSNRNDYEESSETNEEKEKANIRDKVEVQ